MNFFTIDHKLAFRDRYDMPLKRLPVMIKNQFLRKNIWIRKTILFPYNIIIVFFNHRL